MQYAKWIGDIVLRGTLGHPPYSGSSAGATVEEKLAGRAGVTVELGLRAILSGLIIAAPIGIYSAIRQYTVADYAGRSPSSAWRPQLLAGTDGDDLLRHLVGLDATADMLPAPRSM